MKTAIRAIADIAAKPSMRKLLYCAAALLISPITSVSAKLPEQPTLLVDVTNMPKQMQNGTFVQASFENSVEAAVSDPTLDFRKLIPLLEPDLKSSDVRVRRYAALVVSQLSTRRANSTEEFGPLMNTVIQSIDDIDRGVQVASIVAAAGLHPIEPDSVVNPLRARLSRDDINHESYAILAGFLTKIRPNDPPTDAVVISFLKNPKLSNNTRVQAIQEIGAPNVSDLIKR
jgi:hypothetical protein